MQYSQTLHQNTKCNLQLECERRAETQRGVVKSAYLMHCMYTRESSQALNNVNALNKSIGSEMRPYTHLSYMFGILQQLSTELMSGYISLITLAKLSTMLEHRMPTLPGGDYYIIGAFIADVKKLIGTRTNPTISLVGTLLTNAKKTYDTLTTVLALQLSNLGGGVIPPFQLPLFAPNIWTYNGYVRYNVDNNKKPICTPPRTSVTGIRYVYGPDSRVTQCVPLHIKASVVPRPVINSVNRVTQTRPVINSVNRVTQTQPLVIPRVKLLSPLTVICTPPVVSSREPYSIISSSYDSVHGIGNSVQDRLLSENLKQLSIKLNEGL